MERPQAGYYRRLLSNPNVRIAFTHTPIIGCTRIDKAETISELENSTDPFAQYYINGLQNGEMVTIVENSYHQEYYAVGELYFKS